MMKWLCVAVICIFFMLKKIGLCHAHSEEDRHADTHHLGEKLFYAVFGVEKLPVCLLCDDEQQPAEKNSPFLDLGNSLLLPIVVGCISGLLFCSCLLAIYILKRRFREGKIELGARDICTTANKNSAYLRAFVVKRKDATRIRCLEQVADQVKREKNSRKIRLLVRKRRDGSVETLKVRLDKYRDPNFHQREKGGKRSKKALEEYQAEDLPGELLDSLLCVKPNCTEHRHGKIKSCRKTQTEKVKVPRKFERTPPKGFEQDMRDGVPLEDIDCLSDLGPPQHSSTFVQSDPQSFYQSNLNGSSKSPFVDSSCDTLGSSAEPQVPCYGTENDRVYEQNGSLRDPPTSDKQNSMWNTTSIQLPISTPDKKNCEGSLFFLNEGTSEHLDSFQEESPENTFAEKNGFSFDDSATNSSYLQRLDNSVTLETSAESTNTGFGNFVDSFQGLRNRSVTCVRSALECASNIALQTGRGARYVGRKTVEGATVLLQRTGHGTRVVFAKTADGVHYVIESTCSRTRRRCVARKICAAEKSLLCAIARENLNWSVYEYMQEFAQYGDDTNTALHLVAAVLVKFSVDKARSCAKRHLDVNMSCFLSNESFFIEHDDENLHACGDFSYEN
ncbi:uncharacterized protein LOC134247269 isoform X2 [Saccostrea cucullata]|uniref:uncharacterized protein LOC134247269 isoform X2 n=1 Tax=Saccostrea cuccullata TaxID=36930 RepID=UPI002ED17DB8